MNVLNIITGSDNGGGGEYVLNICRSTLFNPSLICIGEGKLLEKALNENINVRALNVKEIMGKSLEEYIEENNIDIILWHGAKAFFLHKLMNNKIKNKSIAVVHSNFKNDFSNNGIKKIFFTPLSYLGLRSFKRYIAVSKVIKELIKKSFDAEKIYVVRNSIDIKTILGDLDITREKIGIGEDQFLFINVGRLHPVKNQINLLKGYKLLTSKYKNCKMIIVGDGSEKKRLEKYINENNLDDFVIMLGEQDKAYRYIDLSDANILSSKNEGGEPPIVVLEGAVLTKPTLCSDIGFLKEIINKERGYIFNPNNEYEIFKAMENCLNDSNRLTKAEKLKEYVLENHTMEKFYEQYYMIFNECIRKDSNNE
ncbi:glycosyltransferase [Clostridium isatidis]|uniref:Glycosyl transferase n=1 Tax=Clostridium isatidis TaxID=182773 RepID=A0A343JAT4_9CLOT|nr:glycosyltransferase [Clostridium isatidis]ASW42642.1 hypothetical protein BEN51_03855 [Clostridium isatidis]